MYPWEKPFEIPDARDYWVWSRQNRAATDTRRGMRGTGTIGDDDKRARWKAWCAGKRTAENKAEETRRFVAKWRIAKRKENEDEYEERLRIEQERKEQQKAKEGSSHG